MIEVNGERLAHRAGMTVKDALEAGGFRTPLLIVRLNGELVRRESFATHPVPDEAQIQVIRLMSGG